VSRDARLSTEGTATCENCSGTGEQRENQSVIHLDTDILCCALLQLRCMHVLHHAEVPMLGGRSVEFLIVESLNNSYVRYHVKKYRCGVLQFAHVIAERHQMTVARWSVVHSDGGLVSLSDGLVFLDV
jgi:hypothetical protein